MARMSKITKPQISVNDARWRVIQAAKLIDSFFRHMIKINSFSIEDMSDPELELMDAVKALRKIERKKSIND
jgi:hypothetical protein